MNINNFAILFKISILRFQCLIVYPIQQAPVFQTDTAVILNNFDILNN